MSKIEQVRLAMMILNKCDQRPETAEEVQASLNETMASLNATQEGLEKTYIFGLLL